MNTRPALMPVHTTTRARLLLSAGMAIPLAALGLPAHAQSIVQEADGDIAVTASAASGTPVAVELSSANGSVSATVTNITGSAAAGERGYIVGLETLTGGNIVANLGSVTGTGEGELLGVGAESYSGAIDLTVGTVDVTGVATSGVTAHSVDGTVEINADSVIARGTGADSEAEFFEAVQGISDNNSVAINVGHAETYGQSGSAIGATAGGKATIVADTAVAHSEGVIVAYGMAAGDVSVDIGTVTLTAEEGQGVYIQSAGGNATLSADTIEVGDYAQGARVVAAYDVNIDVGSVTGGSGLRAETNMGDITVNADTIDTWSYAVSAQASAGNIAIDAGTVGSKIADAHTVQAATNGTGSIAINVDQAKGAGVDRVTLLADTEAGDISITAGSVIATGDAGVGVVARSYDGNITVDVDHVASSGLQMINDHTPDGVYVNTVNGTANVAVGTASAEGYAGSAVAVVAGGGASIIADEASAAGQFAAVLYASSASGDATVDAGTVTLRGDQQAGVNALATAGTATVTVDNIVGEGTTGSGVFAQGGAGASVVSGTIDVELNGVRAIGRNGTDVSVVTTGDTLAETGFGIFGTGGQVEIETAEGSLTQAATYGLRAVAADSATVVNGGTVVATDNLGSAIHVKAPGAVSITSAAVEVSGPGAEPALRPDGYRIDQGGIIVDGGAGPISIVAGTVAVEGQARYGISARGNGAIDITADEVTLASADSVAVVVRGGAGDIAITTSTVTTTGASGVGVFGHTTAGAVTIDAGITRVESEGMAGQFTGDAVVATSDSGVISISSQAAFTAGYAGSSVVGISGGDVTVVSGIAETTGDEGVAIYAQSTGGNATVESGSVITTGANGRAIGVYANNGVASLQVGDVTATGAGAFGVLATGREANIVIDGAVSSTLAGVVAQAANGVTNVAVNGSVASGQAAGVVSMAQFGTVAIAEGASVEGAIAGVRLIGGPQGGFTQFFNSGVVTGTAGPAVLGSAYSAQAPAPDFYIQNNGVLIGGGEFAVLTGAGSDVLELTNLSQVTGIADLGEGDDRLVLDFNDDAPAGAVGQVVSTVNVEGLSVDSGNWRAEGAQSVYDFVEIEEGATLTVVENAEGSLAVEAPSIELNGVLNLDLSVDETEGDLGETTIFGTGSLHLVGTATVELTDATGLQHTGGTFVENGGVLLTTQYGGDIATSGEGVFTLGEGGDFTGNLVNDGTFVFAQGGDYSFLGDFSGAGLLEKQGNGRLTFAGLYAFEGTTAVLGGSVAFTGQLSEDTELDLSGDGVVDLSQVEGGTQTIAQLSGTGGALALGETQLVIDQSANTVFTGEISGTGTLLKTGGGDLKLNGDGSSFTGTGEVDEGTLSVNGNFANATFEVNEGGKLGGNGTVGDTFVQGGTLGAGNSIGTLNVAGDLAFTSSSVLEVEVDPAGNADSINVSGTATLGGAAVNVLAANGTYRPLTDYTILTAGTISGTFGSVDTNLAFLDPTLVYSANAVTLRLARNDIDFAAFGTTPNESAIANLIESFGYGNALYNETLTLADSDVAVSFASLTGDVYPAYASATVETAEILRRQTLGQMAGEGTYAWATGIYNQVHGGNSAGAISLDGKGVAGGLGFGANGFSASAGIGLLDQDRGGSQFSDGEVTFAIGQVGYDSPAGFSAHAGVQAGWVEGDTRRQTRLGAIDAPVTGSIEGDYLQLFGELAFKAQLGGMALEPFAGVSHVSADFDSVTETGAATALEVAAIERKVTFADVGLRVSGDAGGVRPFASAAYRTAWGDRASAATVGFTGPTGSALIGAIPVAKSAAELSAGLAVTRGPVEIEVNYDGMLSKAFDSHGITAGLKFHF